MANDREAAHRAIAAALRAVIQRFMGESPEEVIAGHRTSGGDIWLDAVTGWRNLPRITIVCASEHHARGKVAAVAEWPVGGLWAPIGSGGLGGAAHLVGSSVVASIAERAAVDPSGEQERVRLETKPCPLCGDHVAVRAEKVDPLLQELQRHGVSVVDLRTIRAYLRRNVTAS